MNLSTFTLRSLFYHRRTHFGVVLASAVSAAVLTGAMLVGKSIRGNLQDMALTRLGNVELVLTTGDRFVEASLANRLGTALKRKTAAITRVRGTVTAPSTDKSIAKVTALGVDTDFWGLSSSPVDLPELKADSAVLSERTARALGVAPGDEIVLRHDKPGYLSRDNPFVSRSALSTSGRFKVVAVVSDDQLGAFSIRTSPLPAMNIFLPRETLNRKIDRPGRANLILVGFDPSTHLTYEAVDHSIRSSLSMSDLQLNLRALPELRGLELTSERIIIDNSTATNALSVSSNAVGILTYLVNTISSESAETPYSFVSAPGAPLVPADMSDKDIILNSWLADDLQVGIGDKISLTYFAQDIRRAAAEKTNSFIVKSIVPIEGPANDPDLVPVIPGIVDVEACDDWDSGIAIDTSRIRKKDEDYWNKYKGTPKAFVTLNAAQKMWQSRFGKLTSVRYPPGSISYDKAEKSILAHTNPAALGLIFLPIRMMGIRAAQASLDFGQLFISLSFFVVAAGVMLMIMLFMFHVEQRAQESSTLRAMGFPPNQVRKFIMTEGLIVAGIGSLLGSLLGAFYCRAILFALSTLWRGAVGQITLELFVPLKTILHGAAISFIIAAIVIFFSLRRHQKKTVLAHQHQGAATPPSRLQSILSVIFAIGCTAGALVIIFTTEPGRGKEAASAFFGAGSLLLVGGLATIKMFFARAGRITSTGTLTLTGVALRNCGRHSGRGLGVVGLLACGIFIVVAVGANRHDPRCNTNRRDSGTGGFAYYAETAIPVLQDLNTKEGLRAFGLEDKFSTNDIHFVQIRLLDGDDASCLSLSRAIAPRLLGVRPADLNLRKAFTFARSLNQVLGWLALNSKMDDDRVVPGIADQTVITYGLGLKLGGKLAYIDENGEVFGIKLVGGLANSIFQGSVILQEQDFTKHFPSSSGTRVMLIDGPKANEPETPAVLREAFRDYGFEMVVAADRLAQFSLVENTYLSIFLILGSLGLLVGSIGMGLVVLRNTFERRSEWAILRATGFSVSDVRKVILTEHSIQLAAGMIIGIAAAIIASLPALLAPSASVPMKTLAVVIAAIAANGLLWTVVATRAATRGTLLSALREE